ncbi:phospholipase DDHD1-like isoform X2 [Physella acuta]|uniref:phospholipase DDHD1-like isoform X2 n=1 Tax=Physella acuta TaxID=109671 RepID=UPI0027DAD64F|nr:phospholipase DDHD1-like isoform X2 [Physella acuta]
MPLSFASSSPSSGMSSSRSSSSSTSSNVINGDKLYPSLESICYRSSEEDEDFDTIALDESHSSSSSSKRYLYPQKEFVEELRPEEVRWFHKLQTDTGKNWTAFIGYDSLRIECRYRALNLSNENGDIDENEKILVRGGLYEVDIKEKKCVPVYWSEEDSVILRGIWFEEGSWQPLEESFANQIESEHMAKFQGLRLEEAPESQKGPKPVVHNLRFKDFHVDWNASNEVHKYSENTSSKLLRNVRQSMGLQKSGNRLFRGYCYEAVMDDKPPDINHLVFVIHGIGQKMDTGSIVRCTKDLRDRVKYMRSKMFPDFDLTNKRAEFLPVQWRSSLKLDGDTVETVTPHKMKGVRNVLNSSAMDVLYYTSPLYRFEITNSLKTELCRLYQMFCSRHPYFEPSDGKVSIVAHSLGSVISYDIITGWNPLHLYDQLITSLIDEEEEKACGNSEVLEDVQAAKNKVKDLDALMKSIQGKQGKIVKSIPFNVENLFCIGSPLAVFLALRGVRPEGNGSQNHILSTSLCKRLFNIFHPSDPVAYRLEPLILKHYSTIMPLPIHHFSAPKKLPYSMFPARAYAALTGTVDELGKEKPTKEEDIGETSVKEGAQKFSLASWFSNRKKKDVAEKLTAELQLMNKRGSEAAVPLPDADNLDKTVKREKRTNELEYRMDFQLREQRMENSYLSVLTSHTSYWLNKDISYFLLTHLHPELQEGETP